MFRRWLAAVLLLGLFAMPAQAYSVSDYELPVDIRVNGHYIKTDTNPFIIDGTTYVPLRFVSEALSADEVLWDGAKATATIVNGNQTIQLRENQRYAYVNGKQVALQGAMLLVNSRAFVPVRFVSETFDATVNWDGEYFTVDIWKNGIAVPSNMIVRYYTEDEIFWLGRIIEAESRGEPLRGKIAVGNVILNRVKSREYPDTIYNVIFDRNHGVQFQPAANGTIYNTPSADSIISAKRALRNENYVGNSLYFLNPRKSSNFWIPNNRPYYTTIANHDFYL